MSLKTDIYHKIGEVRFEKDFNLYDPEEAGKTIQIVKINGKEISMKEFKKSKGINISEKMCPWTPIFSKS